MCGFSVSTKKSNLRLDLFKLFNCSGFKSGYADHSKYGINKNLIDTCKFVIKKIVHIWKSMFASILI